MSLLLEPYTLRQLTLPNRIAVSPMCQYSAADGLANDWHLVHLGSRAVGGAGLVITEAVAVTADGRITAEDLGLWADAQIAPLQRITRFITAQGAVPGIQLAHAGRKASTYRPWLGKHGSVKTEEGGWQPVGPSKIAFDPQHTTPRELTLGDIQEVVGAFVASAERALQAGFKVLEVHAAHGYLLHQFLSSAAAQRAARARLLVTIPVIGGRRAPRTGVRVVIPRHGRVVLLSCRRGRVVRPSRACKPAL